MFYEVSAGHNLLYDPFKAIVSPRPIGWISTLDLHGTPNLAPYSFFNAVSGSPPMLMFSSEGVKDTVVNVRETGEFVFSLASTNLQQAMNITSDTVKHDVNEYELAELDMAQCKLVSPPRVAASPASLECKCVSTQELSDIQGNPVDSHLVIGQVVAVHIDDQFIVDGRFDTAAAQPLARAGYRDYASVTSVFELMRPTDPDTYDGIDR
ncbi:MAG: flavin reductase family protein [Gammaproteobacteria bacterium]|nr:flavin reductase family protein [Gammaproteobacteria bacterium]